MFCCVVVKLCIEVWLFMVREWFGWKVWFVEVVEVGLESFVDLEIELLVELVEGFDVLSVVVWFGVVVCWCLVKFGVWVVV